MDKFLILPVQCGSGFIENDNRRVFEQHTRNGNALLLSAREFYTHFTCRRIVTTGQSHDKVVYACLSYRRFHLPLCSGGLADTDIVPNARVEEEYLLLHHRKEIGNVVFGEFRKVLAAQSNGSRLRLPETHHQACQCAFA